MSRRIEKRLLLLNDLICFFEEQSVQYVLQECRLFEAERNTTWPQHTSAGKAVRKQGRGTREDNTLHLDPCTPSVMYSECKEEVSSVYLFIYFIYIFVRVLDYDTYSAHDAIGKVYIDLTPLLTNDLPYVICGWFPIYDTMHGQWTRIHFID